MPTQGRGMRTAPMRKRPSMIKSTVRKKLGMKPRLVGAPKKPVVKSRVVKPGVRSRGLGGRPRTGGMYGPR